MNQAIINLLLVEDSPSDALILTETLKGGAVPVAVTAVERLSEAIAELKKETHDVVLLDLTLPDSDGIDTFITLREAVPGVPVVVLTGLAREDVGMMAVRSGAQDYLMKGQIDKELLSRAVRYAVERDQLQQALVLARESEQNERELRSVAQLLPVSNPDHTSAVPSLLSSRESVFFKEIVNRYEALLEMALERQVYRVEHDLSGHLNTMAKDIGKANAGPRDVVEIHTTAFEGVQKEATPQKTRAYIVEGRVMMLELMGYLVSFYQMAKGGTCE